MKSISSTSIKNKKFYIIAIIILVLLITFIITIFNFFYIKTKIKKLQQDLDNKTQLIPTLAVSPQSEDSEILLKHLDSIIKNDSEQNENLTKSYNNLKETINNNNLDKKIRSIFQKAKEQFEQENDDDAQQLVYLLKKFQMCCDELDKIKKQINDQIETQIRSKNKIINIPEDLIKKSKSMRDFLKNYSELIDMNIWFCPELTKHIQDTNDALENYYLEKIKLQIKDKSNLLVKINKKIQSKDKNNLLLFNKILTS